MSVKNLGPRTPPFVSLESTDAPNFSVKRHGDLFELGYGPAAIPMETPAEAVISPEASGLIDRAKSLGASRLGEALSIYATVANNPNLPNTDRALAAARAGRLAHGRDATASAYFLVVAQALDPTREDVRRLELDVRRSRKETQSALELVTALVKDFPEDLLLLRICSSLHLENADVDTALEVAERALRLAETKGNDREILRCLTTLGSARFRANDPDGAVEVLKRALDIDPEDKPAHSLIDELVLPDLDNVALRDQIEPLFHQANQAYQVGDFEKAKALALEILELDKNDGMAHRLFCVALDRINERDKPLISALDTPQKQTALIGALESRFAELGAKVEGMLPLWPELNQLQQASLANSILPFSEVLGALQERGFQFLLALPGQSAAAIDPHADIRRRKAFGRHSYAGRGWAYFEKNLGVAGLEKVDAAAHGRYDTVLHEFAHAVHFYIRDLDKKPVEELSPREKELAAFFPQIETLYAEALDGGDGQSLLDQYSGTTIWEYFAQGTMAYLNPESNNKENAERLYGRNPKLWNLLHELLPPLGNFPPEVPAPAPEPVTKAGVPSPLSLNHLISGSKIDGVRVQARALWERLGQAFEAQADPEAILTRTGELLDIERGDVEGRFLETPEETIDAMDLPSLKSQTRFELQGAARRGAAENHPVVQELRALYRMVDKSQDEGALPDLRARLLTLHERVDSIS